MLKGCRAIADVCQLFLHYGYEPARTELFTHGKERQAGKAEPALGNIDQRLQRACDRGHGQIHGHRPVCRSRGICEAGNCRIIQDLVHYVAERKEGFLWSNLSKSIGGKTVVNIEAIQDAMSASFSPIRILEAPHARQRLNERIPRLHGE